MPFLVFPLNLNKWMEKVYSELLCFPSVVQWHIALHHSGSVWPVQTQQHVVLSRYEGEPFATPHYFLCIPVHSHIYLEHNEEANHTPGAINCRLANRCMRPTRTSWTSRAWSVPLSCRPGTNQASLLPAYFPWRRYVLKTHALLSSFTSVVHVLFSYIVLPWNGTIGCRPSPWRSTTTPRRK